MQETRKKQKKTTAIAVVAVSLALIGSIAGFYHLYRISQIKEMPIAVVDLSTIPNGTYKGSFNTPYNGYNIKVVVNDQSISHIDLRRENNFITYFDREAEKVVANVLRFQRTDVDLVSGATVSSKAILMAMSNALNLTAQ